jgi:hypothetical protein
MSRLQRLLSQARQILRCGYAISPSLVKWQFLQLINFYNISPLRSVNKVSFFNMNRIGGIMVSVLTLRVW